ncbi:MAG: GPI anchored serine-threonine rich family protein [Methylococcaceae bacterium]
MKNVHVFFGFEMIAIVFCLVGPGLLGLSSAQAAFPTMIYPSEEGITLVKGSMYNILWKSVRVDPVDIRLCRKVAADESFCFINIAADIPNSGTYSWTVPSNLPNGSNYKIDVGKIGVSLAGSRHPFTINDSSPPLQLPLPPTLALSINGLNVTASWNKALGADSYTLYYAAYPYSEGDPIGSIDMGSQTVFSINLWNGAAYYVTVESSNSAGNSEYSNIELLMLPK